MDQKKKKSETVIKVIQALATARISWAKIEVTDSVDASTPDVA